MDRNRERETMVGKIYKNKSMVMYACFLFRAYILGLLYLGLISVVRLILTVGNLFDFNC
jgi:hypothetical protein